MLSPLGAFVPAHYGYWIHNNGAVLNIEAKNGHVPFLMHRGEFAELDQSEPYHRWYETAFAFGWVRVVAPRNDRQCFRFQYRKLRQEACTSLIGLIHRLPTYDEYIFEASEYKVFNCPEQAVQFAESFRSSTLPLETATWTPNCDGLGARSRA